MKEKLGQFKEFAGNLSSRTKKIIIAGAVILLIAAIAIAVVLNNRTYAVLFSGLGADEAQQITARLQEEGVAFRYQGDSTIMVDEKVVDQTKATLVQQGYPKSGFTYDTFKDNAGLMTTDSDKNTYKLYELQDRIGATIKLFEGVKDAKVIITLGEDNRYVLSDEETKSSGSVTVIMEDGGSPTSEQTAGIQRLVAKSVPKMEMEDVVVLDGNGKTVSETDEQRRLWKVRPKEKFSRSWNRFMEKAMSVSPQEQRSIWNSSCGRRLHITRRRRLTTKTRPESSAMKRFIMKIPAREIRRRAWWEQRPTQIRPNTIPTATAMALPHPVKADPQITW